MTHAGILTVKMLYLFVKRGIFFCDFVLLASLVQAQLGIKEGLEAIKTSVPHGSTDKSGQIVY